MKYSFECLSIIYGIQMYNLALLLEYCECYVELLIINECRIHNLNSKITNIQLSVRKPIIIQFVLISLVNLFYFF